MIFEWNKPKWLLKGEVWEAPGTAIFKLTVIRSCLYYQVSWGEQILYTEQFSEFAYKDQDLYRKT